MNEAALQTLLDERELRDLVQGMPKALDGRDWDAYGALFLEDAVFDFNGMDERAGREAITDGPKSDLSPFFEATYHHMGQIYYDIDGDEAKVTAYCVAYHLPKAKGYKDHADVGGMYHVTAKRTPDGWRFARVRLELRLSWGTIPFFALPSAE